MSSTPESRTGTENARPGARGDALARAANLLLLGLVAGLVLFGLHQAVIRHFHVDEFHNAYSMQLLVRHQLQSVANPIEPYHMLGGWLTAGLLETASILRALRVLFLGFFVLSWVLLAWSQDAFRSTTGRLGVLLAAALAVPVWRHGFEIRHEIFIVLGVLFQFALLRRAAHGPLGRRALVLGGAVSSFATMNAYKSVIVTVPLLVLIMIWAAPAGRRFDWRSLARNGGWLSIGGVAGIAMGLGILALGGGLGPYLREVVELVTIVSDAYTFPALPLVVETAMSAPLPFAFAVLHVGRVCTTAIRERRLTPSSELAAIIPLVLVMGALFVNPNPFPYNILWVYPFVVLAGVYGFAGIVTEGEARTPLLAATLLMVLGLAFARGARHDPFQTEENFGQLGVIGAAEALTGPTDPVLDGAGLVLTRPPAARYWLLHSLRMPAYLAGERDAFRDVIEADSPPVILGSYRLRWLPREDWSAIHASYVRLAPTLFVLGEELRPAAEGWFEIRRSGRYFVRPVDGATLDVRSGLIVDGGPASPVMVLEKGRHPYRSAGTHRLTWAGPTLEVLPAVPKIPREFFVAENGLY